MSSSSDEPITFSFLHDPNFKPSTDFEMSGRTRRISPLTGQIRFARNDSENDSDSESDSDSEGETPEAPVSKAPMKPSNKRKGTTKEDEETSPSPSPPPKKVKYFAPRMSRNQARREAAFLREANFDDKEAETEAPEPSTTPDSDSEDKKKPAPKRVIIKLVIRTPAEMAAAAAAFGSGFITPPATISPPPATTPPTTTATREKSHIAKRIIRPKGYKAPVTDKPLGWDWDDDESDPEFVVPKSWCSQVTMKKKTKA